MSEHTDTSLAFSDAPCPVPASAPSPRTHRVSIHIDEASGRCEIVNPTTGRVVWGGSIQDHRDAVAWIAEYLNAYQWMWRPWPTI